MRVFRIIVSSALLAAPVSTVTGADMGFTLRARVPVYCQVHQRTPGSVAPAGGAVSLGEFREYCNAPGGYALIVRYAPGTLRGALIEAGQDQVVLDGSGEAVVSRSPRPRFRSRAIVATPGQQGFDTDRLEFQLVPA